MKTLKTTFAVIFLIIGIASCEKSDSVSSIYDPDGSDYLSLGIQGLVKIKPMATGSVEFVWNGGGKAGEMGKKPEDLRAFFSFNAQEEYSGKPAKGEIIYQVKYPDLTLHREIIAQVFGVTVIDSKAWFVAIVTSDTKGCQGDGAGGHAGSCSGSGNSDEGGGCGEETDGHDGGCSDSGSDEGGCSVGGTEEGGCADGGTDEGGCSGSGSGEGGSGSSGGSGSMGGSMGNPLSGKNCRLGQIIAVKVHDVGSPGLNDGLTWKWFSPAGAFVPSIENKDLWPHLCKKIIVGGNIVVHN